MKTRLALLATAALLAGCSGSEPEPTPAEANAGEVIDISGDNFIEPTNMASPTPTPSPTPTETPIPPDEAQQIQEDAEASGMTARVTREETAPAAEEQTVQPADTEEKK